MRTGMLALALGLLTLRFLPVLPPGWLLVLMLLVGLMLLPWRFYPLGLYSLGLCWACVSAQSALDDRLAPALNGRTLWVEGQVHGLPQIRDGVVRFELRDAHSPKADLPQLIRLAWHGGPVVRSGERWRVAVQLRRPAGLVNFEGFDYEAWLLAQRIGASGTVKAGEQLQPRPLTWREDLRARLNAVNGQGREGVLTALVLGDDSGLSSQDWRLLQDTGTVHLLVISGTHVGLLAGLVYGLVVGLVRLGIWPRRWPWLPWACGLAFVAALAYGFLAGFEVPVRRACTMIGLVLLWRWRLRQLGVTLPLLAALVLILLVEPLASLQPGLWLSFAAVGILLMIFSGRLGAWSWWRSWTRAQWLIALGLLPPLLALGLPISLSGPLANLLAVPWVSLVILPLALAGTALLAVPLAGTSLLWLAGGAVNVLFLFLGYLSVWLPAWIAPSLPVWAWLLVALGALLLLLPSGVPMRWLGAPMLALCVFVPQHKIALGEVLVTHLDVGQGLSIILRTRGHALLYDAGPRFGEFDLGERIVVPALRKQGIHRLDSMLLSHGHLDHTGGADAVMRGLKVGSVLAGEPQKLPPQWGGRGCEAERWEWDEVFFSTWRWVEATESNPASCVLLVEAKGERLLLTGDIDAHTEGLLMASGFDVQADWLQVPHHGSRTSSSAAFLQAVAPSEALVSRGLHNSFGHPHADVIARYERIEANIHDSARLGALRFTLGQRDAAHNARAQRRFWRDP